MIKVPVRILDACFPTQYSANLFGPNSDVKPRNIEWVRDMSANTDIIVFTDSTITHVNEYDAKIKIAWPIEPPKFRPKVYQDIYDNFDEFDYILTYNHSLQRVDNKCLYYPFGGSLIPFNQHGIISKKDKFCSMIVSFKSIAEGHKFRHRIVEKFKEHDLDSHIDILGSGYGKHIAKYNALANYKYSIVVEGEKCEKLFTEKIIDCFSVGTIPIYWGTEAIGKFFNKDGIIEFGYLGELMYKMKKLITQETKGKGLDYDAVRMDNFFRSRNYLCVEDWIFSNYKRIFVDE